MEREQTLRRPTLEGGLVAGDGGKVRVVEPVGHGGRLLDADKAVAAVGAGKERAVGQRGPLGDRQGPVSLDEARADQQQIADADVAALVSRAQVDALGLCYGLQLGQRDVCGFEGVRPQSSLLRVSTRLLGEIYY